MRDRTRLSNPFSITKANDYTDEQILQFWVDTPTGGDDAPSVLNPHSPMPIFLLGAKGSGKTHLMRYHSFPLQSLRMTAGNSSLAEGVEAEGYIGIYVRCGGLNAGRFAGKGKGDDLWSELFAYYVELWLVRQLLEVVGKLVGKLDGPGESSLLSGIINLFDTPPELRENGLGALLEHIEDRRRHLDREVNNCVLTGKLDVQIDVTRGQLVFGIPKILASSYDFLKNVTFLYAIDELENLSEHQQRLINSLVRDRVLPTTFRIGARTYGIKTYGTYADQEENLAESEFIRVVLDEELQRSRKQYNRFARRVLSKRLSAVAYGVNIDDRSLKETFVINDERWSSKLYLDIVKHQPSPNRVHFERFTQRMQGAKVRDVEALVELLSAYEYPLVEKACILAFYRRIRGRSNPVQIASEIAEERAAFLDGAKQKGGSNPVGSIIDHYRTDLAAQLRRDNKQKQYYLGLDSFVTMSGGLPRALLTILRTIFDWAIYNGEDPMRQGGISVESQYRGVGEASEWFFESMRKAGRDGVAIQSATGRLAQVFRESRFSDLPIECSLNTFSVTPHGLSEEAQRVLQLCVQRSFISNVSGGQKHKNSMEVPSEIPSSSNAVSALAIADWTAGNNGVDHRICERGV